MLTRNKARGRQDTVPALEELTELFSVFPAAFHVFGDTHWVLYLLWSSLFSLLFLLYSSVYPVSPPQPDWKLFDGRLRLTLLTVASALVKTLLFSNKRKSN